MILTWIGNIIHRIQSLHETKRQQTDQNFQKTEISTKKEFNGRESKTVCHMYADY